MSGAKKRSHEDVSEGHPDATSRHRFSDLFLINGIFNNLLGNEEGVAIKSSNPNPIFKRIVIDNFRKVNALMNYYSSGQRISTITVDNAVDASIIDDKNLYYDIYLEIDLYSTSLNEDSKQEFVSLFDSIDNFNENGKYYVKLSKCELSRTSTIGMTFNFVGINKDNKDLLTKFNSIDRYLKIFLEHKKYGNPLPPFTDIDTPLFLQNINCIVVKTYEKVPQFSNSPKYVSSPIADSSMYAPPSPPVLSLSQSDFRSKKTPKKSVKKTKYKNSVKNIPKKSIKKSNTKKSSKKTPKKIIKKSNAKKTPKKTPKKVIKKSKAKKTPKKVIKKSNSKNSLSST